MGMILYSRDSKGNIDKKKITYLESLKTVNEGIQEFLKDSDLTKDINSLKDTSMQQDLLIMETDLRVMDLEFMLEDLVSTPVAMANLSASRGSSFDLLARMIENKNYTSKEYMKANVEKYYTRNRITEEEYTTLLQMLEEQE